MERCIAFKNRTCRIVHHDDDIPVKGDLAVTPIQMDRMRKQGIAVSSQMAADKFYDGEPNPSFDINPLDVRGVDIAELWQAQMSARKKITSTYSYNKRKYGEHGLTTE